MILKRSNKPCKQEKGTAAKPLTGAPSRVLREHWALLGGRGAITFEFSLLFRGNVGERQFVSKRCFLPICQKKVHFIKKYYSKVRKFHLSLELQITEVIQINLANI